MAREPIDGRVVQWEDFPPAGRKIVETNMNKVGRTMPERTADQATKALSSTSDTTRRQGRALEAIQPHMVPRSVSVARAATNRTRLYNDALARKQLEGNPDNVIPDGTNWYFEHHARLTLDAKRHGVDPANARAASALMSPQNSPENERAAMNALGDSYATRSVSVTPEVSEHLGRKGIDVSEHVGSRQRYSDLPAGTAAYLSDSQFRDSVDTDADLRGVARGGVKENVFTAERVMRGEQHSRDALTNSDGVISAAKVGSYTHNIEEAVPGSATHVEFAGKSHQDALFRAGRISRDQMTLDLYGSQAAGDSNTPSDLLSNRSHTTEDTWQNAATYDQPKKIVGRASSVFKQGGSGAQYPPSGIRVRRDDEGKQTGSAHPDSRVTDSMTLHAFNNKATRVAAKRQGVAPVAMQSVGWTESRVQSGKSRDGAGTEAGAQNLSPEQYKHEVDVAYLQGLRPHGVRSGGAEPKPKGDGSKQLGLF